MWPGHHPCVLEGPALLLFPEQQGAQGGPSGDTNDNLSQFVTQSVTVWLEPESWSLGFSSVGCDRRGEAGALE